MPHRQYFGPVDASIENIEELSSGFIDNSLSADIIGPDNVDGVQIVVGVKGAGKTALGRVLANRFNGIHWVRSGASTDFRFEVPEDVHRSGLLKNSIRLFLLEQLSEHLVREDVISKTKFDKTIETFKGFGKRVAKAATINAPLIKFETGKLFDVDAQNDLDRLWINICNLLREGLDKRNCLIVLDDLDDYFIGIENSSRFVEGLCRAVIDINSEMGPQLSCLLLMKQGVWRTMFVRPEEYDKFKHAIEFLRWDLDQCRAVLASRIAAMSDEKDIDFNDPSSISSLLSREIKGNKKEVNECFNLIYGHSVNGPRDVIDLCNNIKKKSDEAKISKSMVLDRIPQNSDEKLNSLNADYGHLYPEISRFVQRVFRDCPSKIKGQKLSEKIFKNAMLVSDGRSEPFSEFEWFKFSTEGELLKVLFDIGVVGVVKGSSEVTYSIEDDSFSQNQLLSATLQIHRAYRPALGMSG